MTTVLITGGAGFIGSAIVEAALEKGWRVRVLDSLRPDVHGGDYLPDPRVEFVKADVRDPDALAVALFGVDVVCHQAAKVGLGVSFEDAPDYIGSNDLGTAVLLAAMAESGVERLVVASSMVVYGEGNYRDSSGRSSRPAARRVEDLDVGRFDPLDDTGGPLLPELIAEDAPLDPRNVYAASKLAQEHLAAAWARSTGGRAIALRYHNVYGPGMPQNTPYAGVASLFRSALERGEAPRVFEDGAQRRDFVHVRDVASANLAAIEAIAIEAIATEAVATEAIATEKIAGPGEQFRAFNVGSGTVHTIGDLASALSRYYGGPDPVITGEYRLGDVRHITASSERLTSELGWRPTVSFDEGMAEFAKAPLRAAVS
jgi:dTDP-L-rhamnose 4-epimerase